MNVIFLSKNLRDGDAVSEHLKSLSEFLVEEGHEATIISFDDGSYFKVDERVDVERFPLHFDGSNIFNWSMVMNNEMKGKAMEVIEEEEVDLIHASEWTAVPGAVTLSEHTGTPFVLTFHSTENQRGFGEEHSRMISEMEWQGAYNAEKVFSTDEDAKNSLLFDLDVPDEKIEVINPLNDGWRERVLKNYRELIKDKETVRK